MIDQYFGTKELYQVSLRAVNPMDFGFRKIEAGEPVMYFEKVNLAMLTEKSQPTAAKGGWGNMPRVIWENRSDVDFLMSEGVMTSAGLAILSGSKLLKHGVEKSICISKREGPFLVDETGEYELKYSPTLDKKIFVFSYEGKTIQEKKNFTVEGNILKIKDPDPFKSYIVDYYFLYNQGCLEYLIEKERFNGTFSLEGRFYTKDENEGLNCTNILTMPKVRVVSSINLRLGERADPTTSDFRIIGMPERTEEGRLVVVDIIRLGEDIDADI